MKFTQTAPEFAFTTRWEKLDWKKIASVDVEKLVATSNTSLLEDFSNQIAYCRPELEFALPGSEDQTQILLDPGFLKVFRLSQLLIQYLQHLVLVSDVKLHDLVQQSQETSASLSKTKNELQQLRDTLTQARKELRRRKELLATAQTQALGAENVDEYDQCPYCPKKFINNSFLVSHMQRRHQGLPLNPNNPLTSMSPLRHCHRFVASRVTQAAKDAEDPGSASAPSVVAVTQTEAYFGRGQTNSTSKSPQIDRQQVEQIVHELLLSKNSKQDRHVQVTSSEESGLAKDEIAVKNLVEEIKEQLDFHWKFISAKLDQQPHISPSATPGLVETLQNGQASNEQHLEASGNENGSENVLAKPRPVSPIQVHLEQQLQSQLLDMESFKTNLQMKVDKEIQMMEGKLEAQERFWQSKLKQVKEEHEKQIDQVRQDFLKQVEELQVAVTDQQSQKPKPCFHKNGVTNPMYGSTDSENKPVEHTQDQQVSPIKASEYPEPSYFSTPKDNLTKVLNRTFEIGDGAVTSNSARPSVHVVEQNLDSPKKPTVETPIPKPRSAPLQEPAVTEPVRFIQSQPRISAVPKPSNEYEEPIHGQSKNHVVSVSSSDFSGDGDDTSSSENVFDELQPALTGPRRPSLTLPNKEPSKPTAEGFRDEEMRPQPIFSELVMPKGRDIPTIPAVLDPKELKKEKKSKPAVTIQSSDKLPKANSTQSPLTKLFTAVRMVKHAMVPSTSRRKSPVLTVSTKSKQIKKPGLFSKARWARGKKSKRDSDDDTQADYDFSNCSSSLKVEQHYFKRSHPEGMGSPRTPTAAARAEGDIQTLRNPVKAPRPKSGYNGRTPEKLQQVADPGGTLKKNIFLVNADVGDASSAEKPLEDTKYSRVRRSLLPQFEQLSPAQLRQEESTSESEDTISSGTELDSSLAVDREIGIHKMEREKAKYHAAELQSLPETEEMNPKTSSSIYKTSTNVLKMDTWDETEEDSSVYDEKAVNALKNPRMYIQKQPGRNDVVGHQRPATSVQNSLKKGRDSPLNNSWDSD